VRVGASCVVDDPSPSPSWLASRVSRLTGLRSTSARLPPRWSAGVRRRWWSIRDRDCTDRSPDPRQCPPL